MATMPDPYRITIGSVWEVKCHTAGCGAKTSRPTMQEAQSAAIAHRRKHMRDAGGEQQ